MMKFKVVVYQLSEPQNQIDYEIRGESLFAVVDRVKSLLQPNTGCKSVSIIGKIQPT